jgi:hypothetical protein
MSRPRSTTSDSRGWPTRTTDRALQPPLLLSAAGGGVQRADRYGSDLSLILLDIDHFKQVNDTTDTSRVTRSRELAAVLHRTIRETDLLALRRRGIRRPASGDEPPGT